MQRSKKNALTVLAIQPWMYVADKLADELIEEGLAQRASVQDPFPPKGKTPVGITVKGRGALVRKDDVSDDA